MALKALEIVFPVNGSAVEGLTDRNGNRNKVVGGEKSFSWASVKTKGDRRECKLTKNMFLHIDFFKLWLRTNTILLCSSLIQLCFIIRKLALWSNRVKNIELVTNQIGLYTRLTYVKPYKKFLDHFWTNFQFWWFGIMGQSD